MNTIKFYILLNTEFEKDGYISVVELNKSTNGEYIDFVLNELENYYNMYCSWRRVRRKNIGDDIKELDNFNAYSENFPYISFTDMYYIEDLYNILNGGKFDIDVMRALLQ